MLSMMCLLGMGFINITIPQAINFENSGGNIDIDTVSVLDDDYLIIDYSFKWCS